MFLAGRQTTSEGSRTACSSSWRLVLLTSPAGPAGQAGLGRKSDRRKRGEEREGRSKERLSEIDKGWRRHARRATGDQQGRVGELVVVVGQKRFQWALLSWVSVTKTRQDKTRADGELTGRKEEHEGRWALSGTTLGFKLAGGPLGGRGWKLEGPTCCELAAAHWTTPWCALYIACTYPASLPF